MSRTSREKPSQPLKPRRFRGRKVLLKDVAAGAQVSVTTASRALSQPHKVRPETLARIKASARQLGYLPNGAARALRSRRTQLIGAILPTLDYAIYSLQIEALQHTLNEHGYSLLVTSSGFSLQSEFEQARTLVERGVEGLVLIGDVHRPELMALLEENGIPSVNTYAYHASGGNPCVGFDNVAVVHKAIQHLVDLGHVRIAMLAGVTQENDRALGRVQGVRQALDALGLALPDDYLIEKPYTVASGREAWRSLMQLPEPPTAVFCGSDVLAFGVLVECAHQGIVVPDQLSVVGFDNLEFCAHFPPGMTTIGVPAREMGEGAAHYLISRLAGEPGNAFVELEAILILRGTTAPPGQSATGRIRNPLVHTPLKR